MVPPPKYPTFNNGLPRNGQNPPAILFNPFQFQPPTINNFTMNFNNPGNYHCLVDMNPCPEAMSSASQQLINAATSGTWNNIRTQNGSRLVSPPPPYAADSTSDSSVRSVNLAAANSRTTSGLAVQRFGGPGSLDGPFPSTGRTVHFEISQVVRPTAASPNNNNGFTGVYFGQNTPPVRAGATPLITITPASTMANLGNGNGTGIGIRNGNGNTDVCGRSPGLPPS